MHIALHAIRTYSGLDVHFELLEQTINKIDGYSCSRKMYPSWMQFFPWLLRFVKVQQTDIILTNVEYGRFLRRKGSRLWVLSVQSVLDPAYKEKRTWKQKLFHSLILLPNARKTIGCADKIIAPSKSAAVLTKNTIAPCEPDVLYNGVDTDLFRVSEQNKKTSDICTLLYVGNLHNGKGIDLLPQILDQLGEGYELRFTHGKRQMNIPSYLNRPDCTCIGNLSHEELVHEYNNADLLLFPTRHEGFGFAVAEAMACGLPCIVSNVSSMPELIEHDVNGMLCEAENVTAFAAAIRNLWKDSEKRQAMAIANRRKVVDTFSLQQFQDSLSAFLCAS